MTMAQWRTVRVAFGAADPTPLIQQTFPLLFQHAGRPSNCAVFVREDMAAGVRVFFFSPGAATVAGLLHTAPCARPAAEGLVLVAGQAKDCWNVLLTL